MSLTLRSWATPLVTSGFFVMAVSGTMMFFHLQPGLTKDIHQWAGWLLVVGAAAHVAQNWRPFVQYLKRRNGQVFLAAGAALLAAGFVGGGADAGRPDVGALVSALARHRIAEVAALNGEAPEALVARLAAGGVTAAADQTVAEVAGDDIGQEMRLLQMLTMR